MRKNNLFVIFGTLLMAEPVLAQSVPTVGSLIQQTHINHLNDSSIDRKINILVPEKDNSSTSTQIASPQDLGQGEILLHSIVFQHDLTQVKESELLNKVSHHYGKRYKLSELKAITDQIATWLQQDKGLVKAKAWIPLQEVQNGQLQINIQEGKRGAIRVSSQLEDKALEQVAQQFAQEIFVNQEALERQSLESFAYQLIDYLNQPVQLVLMPSKELGIYDVLLHLDAKKTAFGQVTVDNLGSPYTNQWRDTTTLQIMRPFNTAGQFTFSAQALTDNQKTAYMRYQYPLRSGWKFGLEGQVSDYELCCEFSELEIKGNSSNIGIDAFYTLIRSRELNHWIGLRANYWQGKSKAFRQLTSDRDISTITLENQLYWSNFADHHLLLQLAGGHAKLNDSADKMMDSMTAKVAGDFIKVNALYNMRYPFFNKHQINLMVNGQISDKNLDTSEKISAGGLSGVRAYAYGEAMSDAAAMSQLQYQYHLWPQFSIGAFYDIAYVQRQRDPWDNMGFKNEYDLQGAGLNLQWQLHQNLNIQVVSAAQIGTNPNQDINGKDSDGKSQDIRTWFIGSWSF